MIRCLALISLLVLLSCQKKESPPPAPEAVQISVYTVKPESVEVFYTANGYFEAIKDVVLRPEVSGRVLELLTDEGQFARQGQPLLKIDPSDYENTLRQLEANLMQARANYENQRAIYERRKFLYEQNLIAREDFENAKTQLKVYQDQVSAIEAQLRNARLQLSRTTLRAPFSGYIAQKFVNVGDYITPQSQTFRLVTLDPIKVVFEAPQELQPKLKLGSLVYLQVEGAGNYEGRINFVSPTANASRMLTIKALVKNPKGELKPNMYAQVRVPISSTEAFKIPETALVLIGNQKAVWKVVGDKVFPVKVDIVKQGDGYVYAKADLQEGDAIAVENAYLLNQTSRVKVR